MSSDCFIIGLLSDEGFMSKYSDTPSIKWPCCNRCIVKKYIDDNNICKFKLCGCDKCGDLKDRIYSSEEMEKIIDFRNYLFENRKKYLAKENMCSVGHKMTYVSTLKKAYPDSASWFCDVCKNTLDDNLKNVLHCSKCRYDVCPSCQEIKEKMNKKR